MKLFLHGKNAKNIEPLVQSLGFEIVSLNPDTIISYGGDGTLLSSERKYPGIPKLPVRDSLICRKCANHDETYVLKQLLADKLELKEYRKLHTNIKNGDLFALNDFVIRNEEQIHSIRFKIFLGDMLPPGELLIGDGIVVSTTFGSTGYFKNITGESFTEGFAVALNNTGGKNKVIYLDQDKDDKRDGWDKLGFQLVRGKAALTFDNSEDIFHLPEETKLSFELSDQVARIYEADSLRCPNCKIMRG